MKSHYLFAAVAAVALGGVSSASAQVIFSEDFDDGNAASRWGTAFQLEYSRDPGTTFDGSANFAFDYNTLGVSNPAGGTTTTGAFLQVNSTDQTGDEGESLSIFPSNFNLPSGFWRLDADMYVWNDGGASGPGTTEFGMIGAFLNRNDPVSPYRYGERGGPLAWAYSGEGGASDDLHTYQEDAIYATTGFPSGYASISDYNNVPADTIPGFETGVTGADGPALNSPSGNWVDVSLVHDNGTISWLLNGVEVATYENTGFYSTGEGITFFLGTLDPFNSVNPAGGAIIDNVTVVVPEPASVATLALGGLALLRRRR